MTALPHQFLGREPEHLLRRRIHRLHQPLVVHGDDAVQRVLDDRARLRFRGFDLPQVPAVGARSCTSSTRSAPPSRKGRAAQTPPSSGSGQTPRAASPSSYRSNSVFSNSADLLAHPVEHLLAVVRRHRCRRVLVRRLRRELRPRRLPLPLVHRRGDLLQQLQLLRHVRLQAPAPSDARDTRKNP